MNNDNNTNNNININDSSNEHVSLILYDLETGSNNCIFLEFDPDLNTLNKAACSSYLNPAPAPCALRRRWTEAVLSFVRLLLLLLLLLLVVVVVVLYYCLDTSYYIVSYVCISVILCIYHY